MSLKLEQETITDILMLRFLKDCRKLQRSTELIWTAQSQLQRMDLLIQSQLRKTGPVSSGSTAYRSEASTTATPEPAKSITPSSAESTVYVSDLNLKDEWVKISNTGSSPVSLNGWKIEDEGRKHTYTFPSYTLDSGSTVTVYTEKGTDSATELYWQLGRPYLEQ